MITKLTLKHVLIVPLLLGNLLLVDCSSAKAPETTTSTTPKTTTKVDSIAIPKLKVVSIPLPHNRKELQSFKADCDVSVDNDGTALPGTCTLAILRTDSLLMNIGGPFGVVVGKLSAAPTNMIYMDALRSEVFEGNPQNPEMQSKLPFPLSYEDIVFLMRAEVPFAGDAYTLTKDADGKQVFTYSKNDQYIDFVQLSVKDSTILAYQRKSRSGELLFNVNYNAYSTKNGIKYPVSISLHFPMRKLQAKFTVTDIVVNTLAEKYWFSVPKNMKRTKL